MKSQLSPVQIGSNTQKHAPIGMGCSFYGVSQWNGPQVDDILVAMSASLENGITHFDTADAYGDGESERLVGRFLSADSSHRDRMFLASKANLDTITAKAMREAIDASLARLQTDVIDLYYIHWPRTGKDLRPLAEGLESARLQGKIRAIGVSNFTIEQMEQISEVATIDAHQLGYNLLWRFPEASLIPYCMQKQIAVVAYSAMAHGILSGKYERQLRFAADDQRWTISLFRDGVWDHVHRQTDKLKDIATKTGFSLSQLALRWLLHQPGVTSVLVSAKNQDQANSNCAALNIDIDIAIMDEMTNISDAAMKHIPDEGNPFGYHP